MFTFLPLGELTPFLTVNRFFGGVPPPPYPPETPLLILNECSQFSNFDSVLTSKVFPLDLTAKKNNQ